MGLTQRMAHVFGEKAHLLKFPKIVKTHHVVNKRVKSRFWAGKLSFFPREAGSLTF